MGNSSGRYNGSVLEAGMFFLLGKRSRHPTNRDGATRERTILLQKTRSLRFVLGTAASRIQHAKPRNA